MLLSDLFVLTMLFPDYSSIKMILSSATCSPIAYVSQDKEKKKREAGIVLYIYIYIYIYIYVYICQNKAIVLNIRRILNYYLIYVYVY